MNQLSSTRISDTAVSGSPDRPAIVHPAAAPGMHAVRVAAALILLPAAFFLAGCGNGGPKVEVTDAMKSEALSAIQGETMPDFDDWQMEETDSGIRYVELSPGTGDTPWYDDDVRLHYYLWLTDGTLMDSTRKDGVVTPFEFTVGEGRVIKGFEEIVQLIPEGSEFLVVIPWELAYGKNGRRNIPGKADLVYYLELLRIR